MLFLIINNCAPHDMLHQCSVYTQFTRGRLQFSMQHDTFGIGTNISRSQLFNFAIMLVYTLTLHITHYFIQNFSCQCFSPVIPIYDSPMIIPILNLKNFNQLENV